ncbi:MAG TPA: CDP-alcohol phosphatidyltransferase family protein [Terriglobales bacterium]|jgi:archaetidylinositol phosphate synthase|nr:CDP-alcohol phosphatidyltransferase family protein [Terriglobales bacterium]
MADTFTEFCKQVNPDLVKEILKRSREARFKNANRIQTSFLSSLEKRALLWLAERLPRWVNSDHLTLLGFTGQIMAGVSYALASQSQGWLIAGIGFLAVNWFGDSLDGTLARLRRRERPRYGFYVDHMVDSFGALCIMGGLGLSGFMHPYIAGGLLIGFLLLSIQSYLAAYSIGEFRLSFWNFGPTELRVLLAAGNLALLRWPRVWEHQYRLFDIGGLVGIVGMAAMVVFYTASNMWRLYHEESR